MKKFPLCLRYAFHIHWTFGSAVPLFTNSIQSSTAGDSEYVLKVREWIPTAELIASALPPLVVPNYVLTDLTRTIELRQKASDACTPPDSFLGKIKYYGNQVFDQMRGRSVADAGHAHFLQVLKDVHQVLRSIKPVVEDPEPASQPIQRQRIAKPHGRKTAAHSITENRFAKLQLEISRDILESDIASLDNGIKHDHDKRGHLIAQNVKSTTDESPESSASFAIWCFFKDLNDLLDFVAQTWSEYCIGKLDLTAAAVAIDTAIALVRSMEENFQTRFPEYFKVMMRIYLEGAPFDSKRD